MPDLVFQFDIALFHVLNGEAVHIVFDKLFPLLTDIHYSWPLYTCIAFVLLFKGKLKGRIAIGMLACTLFCTDQISTHIIKPTFNRERPCRAEQSVRMLVPCGPGQSFPSTHAINNSCLAIMLGLLFPAYRIPLFLLAFLVGYSRIYVGVHYPLDVLGGFIIGGCAGYCAALISKKIENRIERRHIMNS